MAGFTNKLKYNMLVDFFNGGQNLYMALCITTAPTADHNTLSELTQIATGNGYADGGSIMVANGTNFPVVEDDGNDRASIAIADLVFTASGGPIPSSGAVAVYAVITDDNATVGSREVLAYFTVTGAASVSDGQTLTISGGVIRANES